MMALWITILILSVIGTLASAYTAAKPADHRIGHAGAVLIGICLVIIAFTNL